MLKREELQFQDSCLNRADAEEPVFVLLGRDKSACEAIYAWCAHRVSSGKNSVSDPKIEEAMATAFAMQIYAANREK